MDKEMNDMQTLESAVSAPKAYANGSEEKMKRHHIMLVNLMGFTRLSPKMNQQELSDIQQAFSSIIVASISPFHGNIVKNAGYAYLVTFDTVPDVLRAGLRIESGIYRHNLKENRHNLDVKIAINTDEPVVSGQWNDAFQDAAGHSQKFEKAPALKTESLEKPAQTAIEKPQVARANGNDKIHPEAPRSEEH